MGLLRRGVTIAATVLGVLAGTTGIASAVTPESAAPQDGHGYEHYVALGDSYTAGPLIPFVRLDPIGCLKSTRNYPSLLADELNVDTFTDISCSGADTGDMTGSQSVTFGSNPPQLSALRQDTDLVTLGIGGNDGGVFGTLIGTCPTLRSSDPTGNPCQRHFTVDGVDQMKAEIGRTGQKVVDVLDGIHLRSPSATVVVIGYPRLAPEHGYCPDRLPLADGDYAWASSVEVALNAALRQAVATDGDAAYIDTYTPSEGHSICADHGAAWINGQDLKLFAAAPFHPFENAMVAEASLITEQLGVTAPVTTRAAHPSGAPTATPQQLRRIAAELPGA